MGHNLPPHLAPFKDNTRLFETGATRDVDTHKLDYEGFLSPTALQAFAEYMHRARLRNVPPGQTIRSSDNWQKGIPLDAYMKSMLRHVMEVWQMHRLPTPEQRTYHADAMMDALCGIFFNVQGYIHETLKAHRKSDYAGPVAPKIE